jgi:hypothetical protein
MKSPGYKTVPDESGLKYSRIHSALWRSPEIDLRANMLFRTNVMLNSVFFAHCFPAMTTSTGIPHIDLV